MKLRPTSVKIHSLEMSLRLGKYESQIKMEDYTTRMPALSNSLGDFVSNNSASPGVLLLPTESLNRTLSSLAQKQSEPSLSYLIKEAFRRLLGSWSPCTCLQAELVEAYQKCLGVLETESNLRLIQYQHVLGQFDDLEGRLREIKVAFHMANEDDKVNKAGLFGWLNYEYWNGHNNRILRVTDKHLGSFEKNHAHINLAQ